MAKVCNMLQNESFLMTGAECAVFIVANRKKIAACLRGRCDEKEDAIAEVVCKCLGVEIGTGSSLSWDGEPFAESRTQEGWLGFVTWQCRARLGAIRAKKGYWIDPGEDASGEEADYRRRKVDEFKAYEFDREAGCRRPVPGRSYDESVRFRAAYRVLEDLVADLSVSRRDMLIWMACDMFRRDRAELAEEFGVKPNNLDIIVYRVRNKLKKLGPTLHRRYAARLFCEAG